ncbi:MAG: hypothetical protein ACKOTA_08770 [Solirubrobacterales bacterium]
MVATAGKTRPALLLFVCALGAAVLMGPGAVSASASVNAFASASDCTGTSCSNFRITLWGSTIKPSSSAKVCFKGRCVKSKSNSAGIIFADFNGVGPYKDDTKTTARLSYRGRYYNRSVRIVCDC